MGSSGPMSMSKSGRLVRRRGDKQLRQTGDEMHYMVFVKMTEDTDWAAVAHLYDVLAQAALGAVIEVNRAVAHGRASGPEADLAVCDAIPADALAGSPMVPAVRGDLMARLGR